MHVFHHTTKANATTILQQGFQDSTYDWLPNKPDRGVWVSNHPITPEPMPNVDTVLQLDIPASLFWYYQWPAEWPVDTEDPTWFAQALISAVLLNFYGPPWRISPEEAERMLQDLTHRPAPHCPE
jgi:hypothetical protein